MHAPTQPPRSRQTDAASGPSAAGIASAVWQKRRWVGLPVAIVLTLTLAWLMLQTPLYRSTSKVLVENQETVYTRPQSVTTSERDLLDQEAIRSQVQIILAADLSRRVIDKLHLEDRPEFDKSKGTLSSILSLIGLGSDEATQDRVLETYYDHLTVYQIDQSRVIAIEFSSRDPMLAAEVANTIGEEYLEMQRAAKRDTTRDASDWLDDQIQQLRDRVQKAENAVEDYRAEHGLFNGSRGSDQSPQSLSSQQLSELATQLATVRSDKSQAEARARLLRDRLESGQEVEASDVMNSQLVQGLVGEAVRLRAQIAQLSSTLGPRHPRMKELTAQLGDLRSQIRDEVRKVVASLESDAAVAAEREREILSQLDKLKTQSANANQQEVELRALEREAKSQRDLLESMLARYREASTRDTLKALPADARIISRAAPASEPYFPRTVLTLVAALLAATILSVGAIVTLELVRLAGLEYEAEPGGPNGGRNRRIEAGVVPLRPERAMRPGGMAAAGHGNMTALCDIVLGDAGATPRMALVTGTGAPADEAAFALSLARSVSGRGARVVLVDAGFGLDLFDDVLNDARYGLSDLLTGRCDFGEVLFRDPRSRVHVLPSGRGDLDPASDEVKGGVDLVLDALTHTYDVVLMLQPSTANVPAFEERLPDAALLVVSAAQPDESVGAMRDRLLKTGVENVTLVSLAAADRETETRAAGSLAA